MRRGAAVARFLILVFVSSMAGAAPVVAGKGEIRCVSSAAYAELKLLANNAPPSVFTDILAKKLLAEDCHIEFVDGPPPVRASNITKRPAIRTRRGANVNEATWDLADIVDHATRTIDSLWDAVATANEHCTTSECGDDFAATGYQTE